MTQPTAAMLVIGDEILSGRTRDINAHVLAEALTGHGIRLAEVRFVPDEPDVIVAAVNGLRHAYDNVFTSGGIGPTHDDITADCIAAAFGASIDVRADARERLVAHYNDPAKLNEARLRMARIPEGADLIDNPVSGAPGFSLGNVHVMAGVPKIFEAMLTGLLPTLTGGEPLTSISIRVERPEGEVAGPLAAFAAAHPTLSIGCYPFNTAGVLGCNLVVRGSDAGAVETAAEVLRGIIV